MSIFFRTKTHHRDLEDGPVYLGALFLALVLNMFNGVSQMAITIEKLPVFYKHRDFMFYPAWAYSIPIFITEIPISIIESITWVVLTYYTIGYAPNPTRVFRQILILVVVHQTGLALFRFLASLARNLIVGNSVGVLALMTIFVMGGFILSRGVYISRDNMKGKSVLLHVFCQGAYI